IRTELGREIRSAFVAEPGFRLLSADYSQIELRILAHMSGDEGLIEAFRRGEDIHTRTAAEVLGCSPDQVTERERRLAKVVNYGIVYGLSAYGLAQQTGMSPEEAQEFIRRYFDRYPAVRAFLDRTLEAGRRQGYVETLLGRRCYIPELSHPDPQVRQAAERQAVNMPIQGTAADLMKRAMIRVWETFRREGRRSRILLQVHDELVVEVPDAERAAVVETVRTLMETVYPLQVPLAVSVTVRRDWTKE
ncbi:MAG: DNA polymerase, partial [Acidobacteria bacterium]|nr:DNA polymerase [Acidobacteriota bacterium]MDW7985141.1 DNA polymerase [Acidobacteriota bacterium]